MSLTKLPLTSVKLGPYLGCVALSVAYDGVAPRRRTAGEGPRGGVRLDREEAELPDVPVGAPGGRALGLSRLRHPGAPRSVRAGDVDIGLLRRGEEHIERELLSVRRPVGVDATDA